MTSTANVTVAVRSELMMDYQLATPYADPTPMLAAAPVSMDQVAFYTVTSSGGVAQVAPDPSSDTGWTVTDLGFSEGIATSVAAYLDTDLSTVVFAATAAGLYSARSTQAWAWGPADLGQPAGWSVGGVRTQQCAWQGLAPVAAVAAEHTFMPVQSTLYCQVSGESAYTADDSYPSAYTDWSPGPVMLPGQSAPLPGAFVSEPGVEDGPSYPAGIRCTAAGGVTSAFLEGAFTGLATTVNNSGWLEAFVIDAMDGYSLNYLSPAGGTFAEVAIAQTPADGGQQVASYPIGSLAAATDGQGIMHVIACTTDGTLLHVSQNQDAGTGWDAAAPIAKLGSPAELAAVADHGGDVHVFARADRSGQVSYLQLSVATGEWTVETISTEVPHQDYVQQIATYSATVSVYQAGGVAGCGLAYTVTAKDPVAVQIDGSDAALADGTEYSGVTGPDGQVVIVCSTSSLSMPALYAWFEGMPEADRIAIHMSGPAEAEIKEVTTGAELLQLPTAYSNKLQYTTGTVLSNVSSSDADNAADSIDAVMALTNHKPAGDQRLHPSSRPYAARYLATWDGTPADQIDRDGCPDQSFKLDFSGSGPLFERLDALGAAHARAELEASGSWLPDISWGDVFSAVADAADIVTSVVVQAAGGVIDATISMVVDGISYVWNAVVTGVGQLLDLVQTIFARLEADFWALVGWLGWVFNWNDILLTHQATSYFVTNAAAWAKYGLASVQGQIGNGIAGLQASISDAVSTYLASQVPAGSTLISMTASQPAPPPGTDNSGDPRNVFGRGLRANGNAATITASNTPLPPQVQSAGDELLSQAGQYAAAAVAAPQLQALTTLAQPTATNPAGIWDQPLAEVIQAVGDGATWGLGLIQAGANTMFDLAGGTIDGMTSLLTETWDIPLVTDIYSWVTNGSDLSALDVVCLLLAVPATITYKALFGETPIPDQDTLDAIMAAYPPPPALGDGVALDSANTLADDPTPLEIGARLGNVLTGLSYIASGFLEARVDVALAIWTVIEDGPAVPRCPAGWDKEWWVIEPAAIWERLFVLTEFLTSAFSVVPLIQNWTLDCDSIDGQATWLWIIGNIQWILDFASLVASLVDKDTIIEGMWKGAGPLLIMVLGVVQVAWQIYIWCQLGSKGWAGSLAGVLTAVPNVCKPLMSPQATWSADGVPVCALAEAALDIAFNFIGGIFYVLAGTHASRPA